MRSTIRRLGNTPAGTRILYEQRVQQHHQQEGTLSCFVTSKSCNSTRVSGPDPRFAGPLLEQFGGSNGELKTAMQYFIQAFSARQPHPDKYDLLMDIASEEFSHMEIVGATVTMLLQGVNGELKDAAALASLAARAARQRRGCCRSMRTRSRAGARCARQRAKSRHPESRRNRPPVLASEDVIAQQRGWRTFLPLFMRWPCRAASAILRERALVR